MDAVDVLNDILSEATESGIIEGFGRCYGVPTFDVECNDGSWIQVTVRETP